MPRHRRSLRDAADSVHALEPVSDKFYGDRAGSMRDPYGQRWPIKLKYETVPALMLRRLAALLLAVWMYPVDVQAESAPHSERERLRMELSPRLLFMSEEGLRGVALENSAQVSWRCLALGPGFRLGSFFSPREQAALFLDLGFDYRHAGFRSVLQGRVGLVRQSDVGADAPDWFGEYEPYRGVAVEQGFAGARASLSRLMSSYEIADIWIGLAAAYEHDFQQIEVEAPGEAARPGEIEVVGGRRWLLGIELTISIAPFRPKI